MFFRKNKVIDAFANSVADELASQIPPSNFDANNNITDKKLLRQFDKELNKIVTRLQEFKVIHKLGIYGKARFHLTFKERLLYHGYPEITATDINEYLLIKVP